MEPIEPPWQAINEWIPDDEPNLDWFNRPQNPPNPDPEDFDRSPTWQPEEIRLDDDRTLAVEYPWAIAGLAERALRWADQMALGSNQLVCR
ncbi:hypothetical protein BH23VER1_BH23VER1_13660 [soil metagenome]